MKKSFRILCLSGFEAMPSCRAMAEDVVKGLAKETDCIFVLREKVKNVADTLSLMGGYTPPMSSD